jgi:hypothetical protein
MNNRTSNKTSNTNPTAGTGAEPVRYYYFVSFTHNTGGGINFVNTGLALYQPIRTLQDTNDLAEYFRGQGYVNPLILAFHSLPGEAELAAGRRS